MQSLKVTEKEGLVNVMGKSSKRKDTNSYLFCQQVFLKDSGFSNQDSYARRASEINITTFLGKNKPSAINITTCLEKVRASRLGPALSSVVVEKDDLKGLH